VWSRGRDGRLDEMTGALTGLRALVADAEATLASRRAFARALMLAHYHLAWADRYAEADALLDELRGVAAEVPGDAVVIDEAAEALLDATQAAFGHRDDPALGTRLVGELFSLALRSEAGETARERLAHALETHYAALDDEGALERLAWQLRALARREAATPPQRDALARTLAREYARLELAGRTEGLDAIVSQVRKAYAADATDAQRDALADLLGREIRRAARHDAAHVHALLEELRPLATNALSEELRTHFAVGLAHAHRALLPSDATRSEALRRELRTLALADDALSVERWQYAKALSDAVRSSRTAGDDPGVRALLREFDRLVERAEGTLERDLFARMRDKLAR
jgi:hypothetical protein